MKKKNFWRLFFIASGILVPLIIVIILANSEAYEVWNSWGLQEDGYLIRPDAVNYILLVLFKLTLYVFPPLIIAIGFTIRNKQNIQKNKYLYYMLVAVGYWFLSLLIMKLVSDSILELDRIYGFKLFNSIKDIQTLIGYILTVILKRTIEIKPGKIYDENK